MCGIIPFGTVCLDKQSESQEVVMGTPGIELTENPQRDTV